MAEKLYAERDDARPIPDRPVAGRAEAEVEDAGYQGEDEEVHPLVLFDDPIDAHEEAGSFDLLCRGPPLGLDTEEVAGDAFGEVQGKARHEEDEHRHVFDVLEQ